MPFPIVDYQRYLILGMNVAMLFVIFNIMFSGSILITIILLLKASDSETLEISSHFSLLVFLE
jgi:hypothetical protein